MRTRWSPSSLQTFAGCPRRFALHEDGWVPKPDPLRPLAPHTEFGRIWHAAAEMFDRARFLGATLKQATDGALNFVADVTWTDGRPWAGTAVLEWRCHEGKVASEKTGRPVQCPASKDWWIANEVESACPKCGSSIDCRRVLVPDHIRKNRATLLRAVFDYCEEALPGVVAVKGKPGLELDLGFTADGLDMRCRLDRYTDLQGAKLAHERKTGSRPPYWDGYRQTFQMRLYPEALRQNGSRCDGVLVEHYQIGVKGTDRSTHILTISPSEINETIDIAGRLAYTANSYGRLFMSPLDHPGNFAHCLHAAGGQPCEFLKLCCVPPSRRDEALTASFVQKRG